MKDNILRMKPIFGAGLSIDKMTPRPKETDALVNNISSGEWTLITCIFNDAALQQEVFQKLTTVLKAFSTHDAANNSVIVLLQRKLGKKKRKQIERLFDVKKTKTK